ncbi:sarcoplasmic reticulum histidine-rich calcium-binding protein-like [Hippocampus comes]|uniref:sarcoplasmic reticulum histidine-rich calcium-binding protein-like n=1 Tax=Hippocampus comes TaxID=109280 RepID=UPI00094E2FEE|nr:PREDICTED: sarcoplasmic reticulum histidine-rich calcium-binding protein-like [Hippocampus comes]
MSIVFSRMDHHEWPRARDRGHRRYDDSGDKDVEALYVDVPPSHRRKRRRHRSSDQQHDGDRAARRSHYEHRAYHEHRQHAHPALYQDSDDCDDDDGGGNEQDRCSQTMDHADPSGEPPSLVFVFTTLNRIQPWPVPSKSKFLA